MSHASSLRSRFLRAFIGILPPCGRLPFVAAALAAAPFPARTAEIDLTAQVEAVRRKHNAPALAAAVVKDGWIVAAGAAGRRSASSSVPVTLADKFHVGSVTKPMTSTLAAILVAEGVMEPNTTLEQVFKEEASSMPEALRKVTLSQLLAHTGGFIGENLTRDPLWNQLVTRTGSPTETRRWFVQQLLRKAPEKPVGTFNYSNAGYTVAGHMLERVTGQSWEELLRTRLFAPLKIESAGFGAPATPGQIDQPYGHTARGQAVPPGPDADNPAAIGPAGTVHMNIRDLARFAAMHTRGHLEGDALLPRVAFETLHAPSDGKLPSKLGDFAYGLGWGIVLHRHLGSSEPVYAHDGSNTMFMTFLYVVPSRSLAVVVASNIGDVKAVDELSDALIAAYKDFTPDAAPKVVSGDGRLRNLSARATAATGDGTLVAGFVLAAGGPTRLLVRAAGPALAPFGIPDPLGRPMLELFDASGASLTTNAGWRGVDEGVMRQVGAFAWPAGSPDAALVVDLPPGAYTAQVSPGDANPGTALVELYLAGPSAADARPLLNLSSRVRLTGGQDVVVPGLSIEGEVAVLVRAVGPGLTDFGLADAAPDPVLTLVDSAGAEIAANDDWYFSPQREIVRQAAARVGAFDLLPGSLDAALVTRLPAGGFTAVVRERNRRAGTVLLEVYALPADFGRD